MAAVTWRPHILWRSHVTWRGVQSETQDGRKRWPRVFILSRQPRVSVRTNVERITALSTSARIEVE